MQTTPLYVLISLFVHIVSLVVGFGAVIVVDFFGLLWIVKRVKLAQVQYVANITQPLIWLGWLGLVMSGTVLLSYKWHIDPLTAIKLFFVSMLGLNGILLHKIKKSFEKLQDVNKIPPKLLFRISFASFVSQLGWWGALFIGFLHHNWKHRIDWPQTPIFTILFLITTLSFVFVLGELKTRGK